MLVGCCCFFLSWPEWNVFSPRNAGHLIIERPHPIAVNDGESEAGILDGGLSTTTKHENKYDTFLSVK